MGERSIGQSQTWLNPGQIQCMLLVGDHLTSKQIAKRLGISPHTVDQRVRRVLRLTGAGSRREAARLIKTRVEQEAQPGRIAEPGAGLPAPNDATIAPTRRETGWMLPFPTHEGQLNNMGVGQRLFWIVVIAVWGCISSAMYLAGLESLGRVLRAN